MSFKKEDQEYIDSEINKQNKTDKINYYKTKNKSVFILSFLGILLSFVLGVLFTPIGGQINNLNIFMLFISAGIFVFSVSYIFLSFILKILSIFIKKLKEDYYTKFTIKMIISSVIVILVLIFIIIVNLLGITDKVKPEDHIRQLLKQRIEYPNTLMCSPVIIGFSKEKSTLSANAILNNSGLDYSQVYFDNPEHLPNFDVSNHSVLKYTGTLQHNVIICMICSSDGKTGLQEVAIQNGINITTIDSNVEGETLCLFYPSLFYPKTF